MEGDAEKNQVPNEGPGEGAPGEDGKKKGGDIPLSTVIIIGTILMTVSFGAVFLVLSAGRAASIPQMRTEEWEYWGDKFHFKIAYNTSEPVIAGKNFVQVGRGCNLQINSSSGFAEKEFPARTKATIARIGEPVSANQTEIRNRTATVVLATSKMSAYYCANRAFFITSGKYCKFSTIASECNGVGISG